MFEVASTSFFIKGIDRSFVQTTKPAFEMLIKNCLEGIVFNKVTVCLQKRANHQMAKTKDISIFAFIKAN